MKNPGASLAAPMAASALVNRFADLAGMTGMTGMKKNLGARLTTGMATSGLSVSHARTLSTAAGLVGIAGGKSVRAGFFAEAAASGLVNRYADLAGMTGVTGMKSPGASLAAGMATSGLVNRYADLAGMTGVIGMKKNLGASLAAPMAASALVNRFADLAGVTGMKNLGASLATEMVEVTRLLEAADQLELEGEREAAVEVLAALLALIWCSLWIAGWIHWAAAGGQPISEMDPVGLVGSAAFVGESTRRIHSKSQQVLGRLL